MDANIERNRVYYSQLSSNALCDRAYCRNYYSQVKAAYPSTGITEQHFVLELAPITLKVNF